MARTSWNSAPFRLWLANELAEHGWNATELAKLIDVHHSVVHRWVNGERKPSTRDVGRLAQMLGVPAPTILELAGHVPRPRQRGREVTQLVELIETIDWSSPERFTIVRDQLNQLRDRDVARRAAALAATPLPSEPLIEAPAEETLPSPDR